MVSKRGFDWCWCWCCINSNQWVEDSFGFNLKGRSPSGYKIEIVAKRVFDWVPIIFKSTGQHYILLRSEVLYLSYSGSKSWLIITLHTACTRQSEILSWKCSFLFPPCSITPLGTPASLQFQFSGLPCCALICDPGVFLTPPFSQQSRCLYRTPWERWHTP